MALFPVGHSIIWDGFCRNITLTFDDIDSIEQITVMGEFQRCLCLKFECLQFRIIGILKTVNDRP